MPARLEPGTSLVVITGHDPVSALSVEARLTTTGTPLTHVAMGPGRADWADAVRRTGITARVAALDAGWRESSRLEMAA